MKILYDHQIFSLQTYGGISRYFCELMYYFNTYGHVNFDLATSYSNNSHLKSSLFLKHPLKKISDNKKDFLYGIDFQGKGLIFKFLKTLGFFKDYYKLNRNVSISFLKKSDFDIFHPTYYDPYFINYIDKTPFVLTIHDMIHELYPHYTWCFDKTTRWKKKLAQKAKKIIAVSKNTKTDIIKFYNINEDKIKVIYHGNPINMHYNNTVNNEINLNLPPKYILFIGNRGLYKNFYTFILAVAPLLNKDRDLNVICAGGRKFNNKEINFLIKTGVKEQIHYLNINDETLSFLYKKALAFVFPSLYEGFGFPIIEAFSCRCPVLLSNSSSFPEVASDAAVYFDANDEDSIKDTIEKVIYNNELREQLILKGIERGNFFTWEKAANETINLYEEIIQEKT